MNLSIFRAFHKSFKMLKAQDFYTILGVPKEANETEIKSAYFSLAKKFHPDINKSKDAKDKFAMINSAYETLGDREKRLIYNRTGLNASEQEAQNVNSSDIEEFAFNNQAKIKGTDIKISIELTFFNSLKGCEKSVSYDRLATCLTCKGTRAKPGTDAEKCQVCGGYGVLLADRGSEEVQVPCEKCSGLGKVVKAPCTPCKGQGLSVQKTTEKILIPAGIENGFNLKLSTKGNASTSNGVPGDLIIKLLVKEHPSLKRKGFDIYSTITLKPSQAVLGGQVEIETISGKIQLEVSPSLKNCENVRLSNYGIPHLPPNQNLKGHHFVNFQLKIPKKLTPAQRKVFESLAKLEKDGEKTNLDKV